VSTLAIVALATYGVLSTNVAWQMELLLEREMARNAQLVSAAQQSTEGLRQCLASVTRAAR
jgi:hypothetical protein